MHHFKKYWELHGTRRPFPALYEAVRMYGAENVYFDKPEYEKENPRTEVYIEWSK